MAESETECDTPGLDTLGSECVIAHTQVGDLHYAAETEIMTQEDKRLDLEAIHGDLGAVTCVDAVTETDHDYTKSEVHHEPHYFTTADMKGNEALLGEVLLKTEMGGAGAEHVVKVESDHGGELTVESENGVIIHEAHGLQCNECGEIFGSMTDLHQHFEIHKATNPYICVHCGESFAIEASLRGHMKIHMKEKSYVPTGVDLVVFFLVQNGNGEECTQIRKNGHYSCGGRNLTYIPTSIPSSVEMLDFSFNFLPTLRRTVFPQLYNLKLLDLTRCHIHHITDDAFHNVKNVTTLILTGNPVSYIGPDGLNSLCKLQRLVLVDTGLSSLNVPFNNLTGLQELNIGTNNIQSVALPPFMIKFRDFSSLDLHANNISILRVNDTDVLRQMRGNITLILSRNPILYIEPGTFQNVHLRELNIRSAFVSLDAQRDGLKGLGGLNVGKLIIGSYREGNVGTPEDIYLDCLCMINFKEIEIFRLGWFQFYLRYSCVLLRGYRASRQQECSYDAFVIYSSKDESWVMDELVENLENGIPPIHLCLHVRDFEAGKAITSNIIDEGIMGSRKIIVVISKHFTESSWCRFEFEVAQSWLVTQGNANIIIIILEDVEEEKTKKVFGLHKHLKKNTYLKWSGNPISNMRFWIRLRKAVMMRN
ncbi:hypothetical protein MHYP_G00039500 [Metynnis hypsauchen]